MSDNLEIPNDDLFFIRLLDDFDLIMFLSELHDHGAPAAHRLLVDIVKSVDSGNNKFRSCAICNKTPSHPYFQGEHHA